MKKSYALLVSLGCIAIGFAIGASITTNARPTSGPIAEANLEEKILYHLRERLRDGMSVAEFKGVFGPDLVVEVVTVPQITRKVFEARPSGFQIGDSFLGFKTGQSTMLFQIRDGKLVNVNPDEDFRPSREFSPLAG